MGTRDVLGVAADLGLGTAHCAGCGRVSGADGPHGLPGAAADWAGVPGDWTVCAVPTVDGAEVDALLCLLPDVVCLVRLPLHGRARWTGPGGVLGEHPGGGAAAGAVSALCAEL